MLDDVEARLHAGRVYELEARVARYASLLVVVAHQIQVRFRRRGHFLDGIERAACGTTAALTVVSEDVEIKYGAAGVFSHREANQGANAEEPRAERVSENVVRGRSFAKLIVVVTPEHADQSSAHERQLADQVLRHLLVQPLDGTARGVVQPTVVDHHPLAGRDAVAVVAHAEEERVLLSPAVFEELLPLTVSVHVGVAVHVPERDQLERIHTRRESVLDELSSE